MSSVREFQQEGAGRPANNPGKTNDKRCAPSGRLRPYLAAVIDRNLTCKSQTQAHAVYLAGRGEGLEEPVSNVRGDSWSGIANAEQHRAASDNRRNVERPALGHGFESIHKKV